MTSLSELRFFTTPAHDCSYLDGKQAITLFADPTHENRQGFVFGVVCGRFQAERQPHLQTLLPDVCSLHSGANSRGPVH